MFTILRFCYVYIHTYSRYKIIITAMLQHLNACRSEKLTKDCSLEFIIYHAIKNLENIYTNYVATCSQPNKESIPEGS